MVNGRILYEDIEHFLNTGRTLEKKHQTTGAKYITLSPLQMHASCWLLVAGFKGQGGLG